MAYCLLFIVSLLIPYPSVQHFIWPLHWCLLADICNHTYIPECGTENEEDLYNRRLFIDECDLFEYNCDYETDFYPINYSSCFYVPPRPCPQVIPCPSIPPCPDHRFHSTPASAEFELVNKFNMLPSKPPKVKTTLSPSWPDYWYATEKKPDLGPSPPGWNPLDKESFYRPTSPRQLFVSPTLPDRDIFKFPRPHPRTFIKKKKKSQQMRKRFTIKKEITKKALTSTKTKVKKKNTVKKNGRMFNKAIKTIVKKKSSCSNLPPRPCSPIIPYPSFAPTFKNFASKYPVKKTTLGSSLPMYMLKGKRRYSPRRRRKKKKIKQTTKRFTVKKTITKTKIKKNITVKKNGRKFNRAINALVKKNPSKKKTGDSDFLE